MSRKRVPDSRHVGPDGFGNCSFVGEVVTDEHGRHIIKPPKIAKPPKEKPFRPMLPASIIEMENRGEVSITQGVGDSMQPYILDGDILIVDPPRPPRDGDVLIVWTEKPGSDGYNNRIVRYIERGGVGLLVKDNVGRYRDFEHELNGSEYTVAGVLRWRLHRQRRREGENWKAIQNQKAMLAMFDKWNGKQEGPRTDVFGNPLKPIDQSEIGFHSERGLQRFSSVLDIPAAELLNGRLPWGLFRARWKVPLGLPHLGIACGTWLTIDPTIESKVGDCVLVRDRTGRIEVGVLRRDPVTRRTDPMEGWWYGSLDGYPSVRIENENHDFSTFGVIRAIGSDVAAIAVSNNLAKMKAVTEKAAAH